MIDVKKSKKEDILNKISDEEQKEIDEKFREEINCLYLKIIEELKKYCDLREDYYPIISIWAIGTYFHKQFSTYPYLFFNAMKGSGKTRLLNILANICHNGKLLVSLSEAVLFRTASQSSFFIDEFEGVAKKDKSALRELLNVGYKKGMFVERAKKVTNLDGEDYKIERYNLYCPISMANIWGMENVLADRCIILTLERSNNSTITRMIEDFQDSEAIMEIKKGFGRVCSISGLKKIYSVDGWNSYIRGRDNSTNTIYTIDATNSTNSTLYDKIFKTSLNSRHLELFFPLFMIANFINDEVLDEILKIAESIVKEKKETDSDENNDVMLIEYISKLADTENYQKMKDIAKGFKDYYSDEEEEVKWINSRWIGRALKRLVLVREKRKINGKVEVILNIKKAREKLLLFKIKGEDEEEKPKEPSPPREDEEEKPESSSPFNKFEKPPEKIGEFSAKEVEESGLNPELIKQAMKPEKPPKPPEEPKSEELSEEEERAQFEKDMADPNL